MKIGIDVRKIEDTGIGRYIENLVENLLKMDTRHEYFLFFSPESANRFDYPESKVTKIIETSGKYSFREHLSLSSKAKSAGLDLFHSPHYVLPMFLKTKSVVTIHDLIHIIDPAFGLAQRAYAKFMIRSAISKAEALITVSEHTKSNMVEILGAPENKIHVIPNGGGADFERTTDEKLGEILDSLGLKKGYYLFVGSDRPHKNLKAVERVLDLMNDDTRFVIAGRVLDENKKIFSRFGKRALFMGAMEKEELQALYSGAEALLFPSYLEGFGLPILEAMACKTPVVTSNRSSMPEVAGDAARLVDPDDAEAMAAALDKIRSDKVYRNDLVAKGLERIQLFSWESMAAKTLDIYEAVGG